MELAEKGPQISQWMKSKTLFDIEELIGNVVRLCFAKGQTVQVWLVLHEISGFEFSNNLCMESDRWPNL